jgi:Ni/Co efflux regulator RcnB
MRKVLLVFAAAALAVSATTVSAQPYGDRDRDGVPNAYDRDRDNDGIPNRRDPTPNRPGIGRPYGDRDHDGVPNAYDRYNNNEHHRWARGERLDRRWHSRRYMVADWRRHGWRAPPRGYAYYRTDTGDVVLAAVATGIISSVIANALAH